jgi:hypothetical protein
VVIYLTILDFAQGLRAGTNDLAFAAVEVKHVGTGVNLPQTPVRIEGMEVCSASQALRRDGLNDIPCYDTLLEVSDETLVSTLSDIRDRFVSKPDGRLGDLWSSGAEDDLG